MSTNIHYIAVSLNLCDRTACDHRHRKPSAARRCAQRFTRDSELGQRLVRVFGYENDADSQDGPVYREEIN